MTDIDDHCRAAKAHIEKGDKAKDRAEQHYISAGEHIKAIKEATPDQASFLEIVKLRIGVAKSRTYDLLAIADQRKTVADVQERTAESMRQTRAAREVADVTCPPRGGQTDDDDLPSFLDRTKPRAITHAPPADDMPTAEEANESYQQTIYDHVCQSVDEEMSGETRQRFFAHLKRKYNGQYIQSQSQIGDKGLPA